jgi:hypothetical protein
MSQQPGPTVDAYKAKFDELRRKLVESLGTDSVDVLMERAVREVHSVYPGFSLQRDERDSLVLEWTSDPLAEHSEDYVRAAFSALYAALLIILARLLGKEIAVRLASALDAEQVMQGQQIGPT